MHFAAVKPLILFCLPLSQTACSILPTAPPLRGNYGDKKVPVAIRKVRASVHVCTIDTAVVVDPLGGDGHVAAVRRHGRLLVDIGTNNLRTTLGAHFLDKPAAYGARLRAERGEKVDTCQSVSSGQRVVVLAVWWRSGTLAGQKGTAGTVSVVGVGD